jgi:hypothetical protein
MCGEEARAPPRAETFSLQASILRKKPVSAQNPKSLPLPLVLPNLAKFSYERDFSPDFRTAATLDRCSRGPGLPTVSRRRKNFKKRKSIRN